MVCEVQIATNENLCLTFLVSQSGPHETQALGFHLVQELHYFMFMKLRHHLIFMNDNLSLMFSACARMSPFKFDESQSHVFSLCTHFTAYFS